MGTGATLYRIQLELADIDRGLYESLDLRVAQHPSEELDRVVVRVLARGILHEDDLEFGRGLSTVEDPALWRRTGDGEVLTWVDVGAPSADRLHAASKRARKLVIVTDKAEVVLRRTWGARTIHAADAVEVVQLDGPLVAALAEDLRRNTTWYLTLQDGVATVASEDRSYCGALVRTPLAVFLASS